MDFSTKPVTSRVRKKLKLETEKNNFFSYEKKNAHTHTITKKQKLLIKIIEFLIRTHIHTRTKLHTERAVTETLNLQFMSLPLFCSYDFVLHLLW